mgnify:CR=1 FL=1
MKQGIHPEYREVAFLDISVNQTFIISSAVQTKETIDIDGKTYPLFKVDTSSASHPFYTGAQTRIVEAGRVEKFRAKFAAKTKAVNEAAAKAGSSAFEKVLICSITAVPAPISVSNWPMVKSVTVKTPAMERKRLVSPVPFWTPPTSPHSTVANSTEAAPRS